MMADEIVDLKYQVLSLETKLHSDIEKIRIGLDSRWSKSFLLMAFLSVIFAVVIGGQILSLYNLGSVKDEIKIAKKKIDEELINLKSTRIALNSISGLLVSLTRISLQDETEIVRSLTAVGEEIKLVRKQASYDLRTTPETREILNRLYQLAIETICEKYWRSKNEVDLYVCAIKLIGEDANNYSGYHYMGHYHYLNQNYEDAINNYKQSVSLNPMGNKDAVNLAEFMLKDSLYNEAYRYSSIYLQSIKIDDGSVIFTIAEIFKYISGIISGKNNIPNYTNLKEKTRSQQEAIKGIFDSGLLNEIKTKIKDKKDLKEVPKSNAIELLNKLSKIEIESESFASSH